jgi:hypothetical protein
MNIDSQAAIALEKIEQALQRVKTRHHDATSTYTLHYSLMDALSEAVTLALTDADAPRRWRLH